LLYFACAPTIATKNRITPPRPTFQCGAVIFTFFCEPRGLLQNVCPLPRLPRNALPIHSNTQTLPHASARVLSPCTRLGCYRTFGQLCKYLGLKSALPCVWIFSPPRGPVTFDGKPHGERFLCLYPGCD